MKLVEFSGGNI